jgi:hypothetical protein
MVINHLCENCKIEECPKIERYNEVSEMYKRHLDNFFKAIQSRPRDTKYKEYKLDFQDGPAVTECPYFIEGTE